MVQNDLLDEIQEGGEITKDSAEFGKDRGYYSGLWRIYSQVPSHPQTSARCTAVHLGKPQNPKRKPTRFRKLRITHFPFHWKL